MRAALPDDEKGRVFSIRLKKWEHEALDAEGLRRSPQQNICDVIRSSFLKEPFMQRGGKRKGAR